MCWCTFVHTQGDHGCAGAPFVHTQGDRGCAGALLCTHRETAGVLVRVEVGPKEAQSGTAVVALANEPGTVAAKETVNVDLQLMKEIRVKLEQVG